MPQVEVARLLEQRLQERELLGLGRRPLDRVLVVDLLRVVGDVRRRHRLPDDVRVVADLQEAPEVVLVLVVVVDVVEPARPLVLGAGPDGHLALGERRDLPALRAEVLPAGDACRPAGREHPADRGVARALLQREHLARLVGRGGRGRRGPRRSRRVRRGPVGGLSSARASTPGGGGQADCPLLHDVRGRRFLSPSARQSARMGNGRPASLPSSQLPPSANVNGGIEGRGRSAGGNVEIGDRPRVPPSSAVPATRSTCNVRRTENRVGHRTLGAIVTPNVRRAGSRPASDVAARVEGAPRQPAPLQCRC